LLKPRRARVAAVGLLLLIALSSPGVMALTLPSPPDRSASANNASAPPSASQSFAGGVSVARENSSIQNVTAGEFIVDFYCLIHPQTVVNKHFRTGIAESISGPVTSDQATGIMQAMDSVRPPDTVDISIGVGAEDLEGNLTYTLKAMTYNVTTYSVWVQQSTSTHQKVGYLTTSVPVHPTVYRDAQDLTGSSCESESLHRLGGGYFYGSTSPTPSPPFGALPKGGYPPFLTFGPVTVTSSQGIAGAGQISPGENITFLLPPGTYSASTPAKILGISTKVSLGSYSSPQGAGAAQFTVTLAGVEGIWYDLQILGVIILLAVIVFIVWWFRLWPPVMRQLVRVRSAVKGWVDERMRLTGPVSPDSPDLSISSLAPGPSFERPTQTL
jgi:hypothetical protein